VKSRLRHAWERVRSGYWFLPSLLSAAAIALAFATVALDDALSARWAERVGWAYTGGAEGASAVLGAIAGSMITIAGVVFSLTLLTLSLASTQFGPRLLRNFLRDLVNQVVLGSFVATFLYCLLVLRTIRHGDEGEFVPHLSVTVGVLMAVASIGVLIYFVHHVSSSIQVDRVIAGVFDELRAGIDRLFPDRLGEGEAGAVEKLPEGFESEAREVRSSADGYLQVVDADRLLSLAGERDCVARLERRPGHYVFAGGVLARIWPGDRVDEACCARIRDAFVLGPQRTPDQDVEFSVHQLVEIAVRALSPGVNDPFTAIRCVDRIGSALARLAARAMPSPYRHDGEGRLRVVAHPTSFPDLLAAALDQIRQNARSNAAVTIRLLEVIAAVADCARRPADLAALRLHAEMIERGSRAGLAEERDRADVADRYRAVIAILSDRDGDAVG
jgi:uncharacterized membrane protein